MRVEERVVERENTLFFRVGELSVQQCSVCLWCGFQQAYSQYIPATRAQVTGAQGGQTGAAMDGTYLVEASF